MMCLVFMFSDVYCYDIMFLQQYHAGHEVVICYILVPWCHVIGPQPSAFPTVESFEIV